MSNTSGFARDTAKEAKEGMRDATKAASAASDDIQADLAALRDDVGRLGAQLADILATRGDAVWSKAKTNVEGVVSGVQEKGMDAVEAVRDVGDNVVEAIDTSLKDRPYTTLAIAVGIGFLLGQLGVANSLVAKSLHTVGGLTAPGHSGVPEEFCAATERWRHDDLAPLAF